MLTNTKRIKTFNENSLQKFNNSLNINSEINHNIQNHEVTFVDGNMHIDVVVCMGSSCFARGNKKNLEFIEDLIENHNLDISIELIGNRCEKKCAQGPIIIINGAMYSNVTRDKLNAIFSELLSEKASR